MIDEELTGKLIKAFYKVHNTLGYGFIERVYHNSMIVELVRNGISVETEKPIAVYYEDKLVGTFSADLIIEGRIILELKSADVLHAAHEAQLINYLRSTEIELGFVFNFGRQAEFRRKYFSNKNKRRGACLVNDGILDSLFRKDDPPKSA